LDKNFQNLRDAVDDATTELPDSILDDPKVKEVRMSDTPVISFALSGDFSLSELRRFAESLQDDFESVPNVKEVNISGEPEDKFHIFVDPIKLQSLGLSLEEVLSAIRAQHQNVPMGTVFLDSGKIELAAEGEFETAEDFYRIPIVQRNGQIIHLSDFAEIRREFDEMKVRSYFTLGQESQPTIFLDVMKSEQKSNVFKIVKGVFGILEQKREQKLIPDSLKIEMTFDGASEIRESLRTLLNSSAQTLILIGLSLLFFLGWREALLSFFAIPLSILITIGVLYVMGETFNSISLFALVLALGLLVDNAIILIEGISDNIFDKKLSPQDSAKKAISTFRWPIIAGTLTTVFAFLPMLFMISGISGEYISVLPKTVTIVLCASLFVSLALLPVFGTKFFEMFPPKKHRESPKLKKIQNSYEKLMSQIFAKKKNVYGIIGISAFVMIFSYALFPLQWLTVEVFPSADANYFTASIELPTGTRLAETMKLIPEIEKNLLPYFEERENGDIWLENVLFTVGAKSSYDPDRNASNFDEEQILGITVNFTEKNDRKTSSVEIVPLLKKEIESSVPEFAEVNISELASGPPTGSKSIEIRFSSDDLSHLEVLAEDFKNKISKIKLSSGATLKDIDDNRADKNPKLTWEFDRDVLSRFNLSPSQIASTLRASVEGVTILKISENDDEIDVDVRLDFSGKKVWEDPASLEILKQMPIKTPTGQFIRLSEVATFEFSSELSQIKHRNGKRTVIIGANIEGSATAALFTKDLELALSSLDKRSGDVFEMGGDNEDTNRLVGEMVTAMIIAVFLILALLVLQFDSFLQSFAIVLLLPFSLTGVFIGFWLSHTPISFPTMIGIVALAGIIVNDAIVLISRINTHVSRGKKRVEAYILSGKERMQPIFLTSVTTIFGLLPLALSDPVWRGLGFAIIYGMILSTFLTLLLVPCLLYSLRNVWGILCRCVGVEEE
jgi:multidrug efflux pump subunit AcrB